MNCIENDEKNKKRTFEATAAAVSSSPSSGVCVGVLVTTDTFFSIDWPLEEDDLNWAK